MRDLAASQPRIAAQIPAQIPAMTARAIDKVRRLEGLASALPQVPIRTDHVLHAGMYARTVFVPAGVMITGVEIKIPTLLIIDGEATVYVDGEPMRLSGHNVL